MLVRVDKIRDTLSFSMSSNGKLKQMVKAFITEDGDVSLLTDYAPGSEAVVISTGIRWMLLPDGRWHKVGSDEMIDPGDAGEESAAAFTILSRQHTSEGVLYEIFTDNTDGFVAFVERYGATAAPGSTVDIADVKAVFRLRNDGSWEEYHSYAASEEEAEALAAPVVAMLLDDLLPDDFIEETGGAA